MENITSKIGRKIIDIQIRGEIYFSFKFWHPLVIIPVGRGCNFSTVHTLNSRGLLSK